MTSDAQTLPIQPAHTQRQDVLTLWAGITFSFAFTALIWATGPWLAHVYHLPDEGALWYYWKLADPTWVTRLSVWGLYLAHQAVVWGLIYYAQTHPHRYGTGLHRVNVLALAANALFIGLHYVQTHIWYDGLAQDVSILSSQGSVVVLLVLVLIMENPRRGMFFGKRAPIKQEAVTFLRKYHGYFFAWATIYTFWYHPMEATLGHLIGFIYTFLLMLQGSLFFTRIHINRYWTFAQEFIVLIHGTLVALGQGTGIWPMFFFGFMAIFVITQMYGLGLSFRVRAALLALFGVGTLVVYNFRGFNKLDEILRIPLIDYVLVFLFAWTITGVLWLVRRARGPAGAGDQQVASNAGG